MFRKIYRNFRVSRLNFKIFAEFSLNSITSRRDFRTIVSELLDIDIPNNCRSSMNFPFPEEEAKEKPNLATKQIRAHER